MADKKVQCPHCDEVFSLKLPPVKLDELSPEVFLKIRSELAAPGTDLDHRHKTADEFFDCPGCRQWVEKTASRHQVTTIEPPPEEKKPADQVEEKGPAPASRPAFGSPFKST